MADVSNYNFKSIKYKTVKPEESFVNSYVDEYFESDTAISSTCRIHIILYIKYKKADLNGVMAKQCQKHLTNTESNGLLQLLKKF